MLDSSGHSSTRKVPCFLCEENHLEFPTWMPTSDHGGHPLKDYGECIKSNKAIASEDASFKNWDKKHLFTLLPFSAKSEDQCGCADLQCDENQLVLTPYELRMSHESYHYHGLVMPNFGYGIGNEIYICHECFEKKSKATASCNDERAACLKGSALKEAVVREFMRMAEVKLGEALLLLVREGAFKFSAAAMRRKLKRIPREVFETVGQHLTWGKKNLPQVGFNRHAPKVMRNLKPLMKIVLPPTK